MDFLIGLIVIFCICILPQMVTNYKFSNRIAPEGYQTDWKAMNHDLMMGKSRMDVMKKFNNGGYDIKK